MRVIRGEKQVQSKLEKAVDVGGSARGGKNEWGDLELGVVDKRGRYIGSGVDSGVVRVDDDLT